MELYKQADTVRAEADEAQQRFLEFKKKADEEHNQHIYFIRQVHDFDKIITGIKHKDEKAGDKPEVKAKDRAKEIYEKFKAGEILSTEDILELQKAGYL